jgi:hypothetical protein
MLYGARTTKPTSTIPGAHVCIQLSEAVLAPLYRAVDILLNDLAQREVLRGCRRDTMQFTAERGDDFAVGQQYALAINKLAELFLIFNFDVPCPRRGDPSHLF